MIANVKHNLSFCYRDFVTSFKQLLTNRLKLEATNAENLQLYVYH